MLDLCSDITPELLSSRRDDKQDFFAFSIARKIAILNRSCYPGNQSILNSIDISFDDTTGGAIIIAPYSVPFRLLSSCILYIIHLVRFQ